MTPPTSANSNHYVDYVIHYSFSGNGMLLAHVEITATADRTDHSKASEQLELLLRKLADVGLQTEIRQGDHTSLLVFVRASDKTLKRAVYQSR